MIRFTIPTSAAAWLFALVFLALIDSVLNAVIVIVHTIQRNKDRKKAQQAGYVKITGNTYANGHPIPKWVKSALCIVGKIEGDKALLCAPLGWVNINDFKEAQNGTDQDE